MCRISNICRFNRFSKQIFIDLWPLMKDRHEEIEGYVTPQDLFKAGLTAFFSIEPINREIEIYSRVFCFPHESIFLYYRLGQYYQ